MSDFSVFMDSLTITHWWRGSDAVNPWVSVGDTGGLGLGEFGPPTYGEASLFGGEEAVAYAGSPERNRGNTATGTYSTHTAGTMFAAFKASDSLTADYHPFFDFGNNAGTTGMQFCFNSSGKLEYRIWLTDRNTNFYSMEYQTELRDGRWHWCSVVSDGAAKIFYLDGVAVATTNTTAGTITAASWIDDIVGLATRWGIGAESGDTTPFYFVGTMGECFFTDSQLTAENMATFQTFVSSGVGGGRPSRKSRYFELDAWLAAEERRKWRKANGIFRPGDK